MTIIEQFKRARRVATPLIVIRTSDAWAMQRAVGASLSDEVPKVVWDCAAGFRNLNEKGAQLLAELQIADRVIEYPFEAMRLALQMPASTLIIAHGIGRVMEGTSSETTLTIQAVSNLRDAFASDRRTLVMVGPGFNVPPELLQDLLVLDDQPPSVEELQVIVNRTWESAGGDEPAPVEPKVVLTAAESLRGLASFAAEQATAEAVDPDTKLLDVSYLRERRRGMLSAIDGMTVTAPTERFCDLGGLEGAKTFYRGTLQGEQPPIVIAFIDEIEKTIDDGGGGEAEGGGGRPGKSVLKYFLTAMQDNGWTGSILLGPPGAGKTVFSRALGGEADALFVELDLGALFGMYVGQTEERARTLTATLKAIGGDRVFFMATCNGIKRLPPELKRRFSDGVFFFDLPDEDELKTIGEHYIKQFGLTVSDKTVRPWKPGWTGAEVRTCVRQAWQRHTTLGEAAKFVIPVATQAPEVIESLRTQAHGRYLSAAKPGIYERTDKATDAAKAAPRRAIGGRE